MTTDEKFKEGMRLVEKAGFELHRGDPAVLAAWFVFDRKAKGLQLEEGFEEQAPLFAKRCILEALFIAAGGKLSEVS